jgi:hypothetical protein
MEHISRLSPEILFRQKVLRKAKYRCSVCGGINHKEGYFNESDSFIECDSLMRSWALQQGLKLFRISLQVLKVPYYAPSFSKEKNVVLCRKHAMQFKNMIREYERQNLTKSS